MMNWCIPQPSDFVPLKMELYRLRAQIDFDTTLLLTLIQAAVLRRIAYLYRP